MVSKYFEGGAGGPGGAEQRGKCFVRYEWCQRRCGTAERLKLFFFRTYCKGNRSLLLVGRSNLLLVVVAVHHSPSPFLTLTPTPTPTPRAIHRCPHYRCPWTLSFRMKQLSDYAGLVGIAAARRSKQPNELVRAGRQAVPAAHAHRRLVGR